MRNLTTFPVAAASTLNLFNFNFYGLDTTIVANVQASVIGAFGQDQKLGWVGIGVPLGSVAVILSV